MRNATVRNESGRYTDVRHWAKLQGYEVKDRGSIPHEVVEAYKTAVREWGRENGFQVGQRGRLSQDLVLAFNAAHRQEPKQQKERNPARQLARKRHTSVHDIRQAARKAGYDVGDRGRLPRHVVNDFVSGKI